MTDKYCPLRFREYDSNPHDQRCIGDYCAWFDKCSQSHGEPIYGMPYGNMEPRQVIATEEPQEPRETAQDALDVDSREKLESDFADSLCLFAHYAHDHYERETVMQMVADRKGEFAAFLDRQATITRFQETSNQPNSGFVAQKRPESTENDTAKSEIRDFDDTREKLDAEVRKWCGMYAYQADMVWVWLNRQAAITERTAVIAAKEAGKVLREKIAELQAQLDEAKAKPDCDCCEWQEENAKLRSQVEMLVSDGLLAAYLRHCERIDELQEQLDKLSSDELHWRSEADFWKRKYELVCRAVEDVARNYTVVDEGMA